MNTKTERFYYINADAKLITHYPEKQANDPEGFVFAGMSQLDPKGAAGFYARNQPGYTIIASEDIEQNKAEAKSDEEE